MVSLSHGYAMLGRRQINNDGYYCDPDFSDCNSSWNDWGRWVALAVIIVFFIILAFVFSWLANRRRRRMGRNAFRGTGWIPYAGHPGFHPPPAYGQNAGTQPVFNYPPPGAAYGGAQFGAPPPKYAGGPGENVEAQQTGQTFTSGQGYYGGHGQGAQRGNEGDIELQSPQAAYQREGASGGDYVYPPPAGAPPMKGEKV